jgi:hypothetical protein
LRGDRRVNEPRDAVESPPPLSLAEAERIITRIEEIVSERRVVLVGGQAVALWTAHLQSRLMDTGMAAQVVSNDLDFLGNAEDTRMAGKLLGGKIQVSKWEDRTTLAGVAIFLDGDGYERRLDFLQSPYGMGSEDVRQTAVQVELTLTDDRRIYVWVMHPERCMESRVHNSVLENKQTDLAWRQLWASVLCARAFSQLLLDERGDAAIRDVLNLNERIFRFAQEDRSSRLAVERDIEVFDSVLDDERLPEKFRAIRLAQMRDRIRTLRERQRKRIESR